jgi:HEAT repeat protein
MDEDRALPILKSVLARRDEGSAKLREKAAMMLAIHRSPESERLLIDLAANDPDMHVRGRALYYLGECKSGDALKIIQKTLFESTNKMLREQALKALVIQGIEKTSYLFRDVASRSDMPPDFRERAIRMLGYEGSKEELSFLRNLYDQVEEERLKEEIVMAVGHKEDRASRDWLLRIIADASNPPSAREKAFFWLGEDKSVPTSRLIELYDGLVGAEAKKQAVHVIGQRDDDQAFEFILRVARTESSPMPRRAAIFWLGQSRDPRAIECLEEIIRQ